MTPRHALRLLAGLLLAAALGFGPTALLRLRPWELSVPFRPDPAAEAADRALADEQLARASAPSAFGPDVVLVVLDTVRADRLELYGNPQSAMPRLASWARQARLHTRASAESPWTLPSHASLFTGLAPAQHGAHGGTLDPQDQRQLTEGAGGWRRWRHRLERPLSDEAVTLAERLHDAGYLTLGVVANWAYLQDHWNLSQGFDLWLCEQVPRGRARLPYARADRVTAAALHAVESSLPLLEWPERPGRSPLFLFVNYMDAHLPYVPRQGFLRQPERLSALYRSGWARERAIRRLLADREPLPQAAQEAWTEAYDAELRFLDAQLDLLLKGLRQRGVQGYVVILSDHGEYLGEHSLLEHSKDVYEQALQVPLLVSGPDIAPGQDDRPVQLADVAHWIVDWTGVQPLPGERSSSDLLVSELYGSRLRDLGNAHYGERFNRVRRAFRRGDRKLILGSDGSMEAYDLAQDPQELHDLSDQDWAQQLAEEAREWIRLHEEGTRPEPRQAEMDREVEERLRGLGYLE